MGDAKQIHRRMRTTTHGRRSRMNERAKEGRVRKGVETSKCRFSKNEIEVDAIWTSIEHKNEAQTEGERESKKEREGEEVYECVCVSNGAPWPVLLSIELN